MDLAFHCFTTNGLKNNDTVHLSHAIDSTLDHTGSISKTWIQELKLYALNTATEMNMSINHVMHISTTLYSDISSSGFLVTLQVLWS